MLPNSGLEYRLKVQILERQLPSMVVIKMEFCITHVHKDTLTSIQFFPDIKI